jgi:hypothetical protein
MNEIHTHTGQVGILFMIKSVSGQQEPRIIDLLKSHDQAFFESTTSPVLPLAGKAQLRFTILRRTTERWLLTLAPNPFLCYSLRSSK